MEGLGIFGLLGFVFSCVLLSRVKRLERVLRENGIRPAGTVSLGNQLRERMGQTLIIDQYVDEEILGFTCKVLDVDEDWALILADEGKKKEREMLIRLDSIKQVRPKKGE